ncbi:outer membrane beta-barrel protein [Aquabacterium fontiphilum]|uniref:OmpW/AlkL family protein n=1 Tax=Aquabacterium fontiphilum TaxID=450365 RepID=UPI0013771E99|nr:OmpW family outer membrane protein [Aquabacterium fontiphilum]NBD21233.1 outer membrane beta-barrel protein [Aquabacterium fontiphilum]
MNVRFLALAAVAAISGAAAHAGTYTVKLGGAHIDPRATSSPLRGELPAVVSGTYYGNVVIDGGLRLAVQPKTTLIFSIERALAGPWSAELVLGVPPKHDVKLRAATPALTADGSYPDPIASLKVARTTEKLQAADGQVVATVKQVAPTLFVNYAFLDATSAWRPYVGVGINYTRMKAESNALGDALYNDGPVRIKLSHSLGPALQAGVRYQFDPQWSFNVGWAVAKIKNDLRIRTDRSEQRADYRFYPSVWSATVGYSF